MNYLTRPIFLFSPDWSGTVTRSIQFDLRPGDIGYGATFFKPTQLWTVNTWQFILTLTSPAAIAAVDAFTAALTGALNGFWLPVPLAALQVTAGTSTTVFTIAGESLASLWADRPDQHLFFTFADGTQAAAKIQSVVTAGANETVTLTTALPQTPDVNTAVNRLHYVRLAGDTEEGEFYAEGQQSRKVTVVELPTEYAAVQTGLQPVYLFHFWALAPQEQDWYFTSFAAPVVSANVQYNNFPIDFQTLQNVSGSDRDDLQIVAKSDDASPLALFLPVPFSSTLFVEVFAIDLSAPDAQTLLFSGRVTQVDDDGEKHTAQCETRRGYLRRRIPRYYKAASCQNVLYDQNTCRVGRAWFEATVNIFSISAASVFPPVLLCTFMFPDFAPRFQVPNFLANGLFEVGQGQTYEARTILASSWDAGTGKLSLTLNLPLYLTAAGVNAQVVAGCDHTAATCAAKFNNFVNFNGFLTIPPRNPTLKAINANSVSSGGK
ncbi:MAG: phage BR0599 family protein [Verrucomicrobiae bacterium]|nr:phage BR0599 family protein [Verrucomicrobiae bacterium]